ncbi:TIGR02206 family membrane protein [Corynebacterium riegelii]|uniref:YwaF family protein n=1 Tax=Corynebacterium riegelii TaxID=156976 RepID=UPI0023F204EB|nr:TIGR02206 family membrane protein [Corynebacterium riegelii]
MPDATPNPGPNTGSNPPPNAGTNAQAHQARHAQAHEARHAQAHEAHNAQAHEAHNAQAHEAHNAQAHNACKARRAMPPLLPPTIPYTPPDWTSRNGETYGNIGQFDRRHAGVLVFVIVLCGVLVVAARRLPRNKRKAARKVAGAVLGICVTAYYLWVLHPDRIVWDETAPFHVTDALRVVTPIALLTDAPLPQALSFYWGFLLNPMALLTPDMAYVQRYPGLQEFAYWFFHTAALVVPTVLTFAFGYRPSWKDWRIVTAITFAWAGFAQVMNKITGGNYMFVARHPRGWSLLNLFGPWPYYLLVVAPGIPLVWAGMTWLANRKSRTN